jgi:heptosyltransferase-3
MHAAGKDSKATPNRFLVILPRQLGDVILGLPIIHELRKHFPQAKIAWLAHPLATEALDGHTDLNDIFYLPQGRLRYINKQQGMIGKIERTVGQFFLDIQFIFKLRAYKADVVIDAMNNPRTAMLSFVSGAPKRISFRTRLQRNIMFTNLIDRIHVSRGYLGNSRLKLLGPLEINGTSEYPTLSIPESDAIRIYRSPEQSEKITKLLGSYPIDLNLQSFIVLCPPHRRDIRRWPKESFLELARQLVFKHNIPVVWLWGPGEDILVEPLHRTLEHEITNSDKVLESSLGRSSGMSCLLPLLSIKETAELCSRALCWVGNSSGLSHVAVAAGCRTIEIHGPTNPIPWTHPDLDKHRSVTRMTGCLGCEGAVCKLQRRECLEDLSPAMVLRQLEDLLKL